MCGLLAIIASTVGFIFHTCSPKLNSPPICHSFHEFPSSVSFFSLFPHTFHRTTPSSWARAGSRAVPLQFLQRALHFQHCKWGNETWLGLWWGEFMPTLSSQKVEQKWEGWWPRFPYARWRLEADLQTVVAAAQALREEACQIIQVKDKPNSCGSGHVCFLRQGFSCFVLF